MSTPPLDADAVLAYLKANPDFLNSHALTPNLTSFDAFKQRKLNETNVELREELDALIAEAKRNQATVEQSMRLAFTALDAKTPEARTQAIIKALHDDYGVAEVRLLLIDQADPKVPGVEVIAADSARGCYLQSVLAGTLPMIGRLSEERHEQIFGAPAGVLQSAALARLDERDPYGLLALGAHDAERFHPGTGGFLLEPLALLIGRLLRL